METGINQTEELYKALEAAIEAYNVTLRGNDHAAIEAREEDVKAAEKAYAKHKENEIYSALMREENPILAAVNMNIYDVPGHKTKRAGDIVLGFEIDPVRWRQIDLKSFAKKCGMTNHWESRLLHLACAIFLDGCRGLGMSDKEIFAIKDFYFVGEIEKVEATGANAGSNNQIVKLMREVIDLLLPPDENGEQVYLPRSQDVNFLKYLYLKPNRDRTTGDIRPKTVNFSRFLSLFTEALHHITTGKRYCADFSMKVKDMKAAKPKPEDKKPEPEVVEVEREQLSA